MIRRYNAVMGEIGFENIVCCYSNKVPYCLMRKVKRGKGIVHPFDWVTIHMVPVLIKVTSV